MTLDRRALLSAGTGLSVLAAVPHASAGPRAAHALEPGPGDTRPAPRLKLEPGSLNDQTAALQSAIDDAARQGLPLHFPAGTLRTGALRLPANSKLIGASGLTVLQFVGGDAFVTAADSASITLQDIVFDGGLMALDPAISDGLLRFEGCPNLTLTRIEIRKALLNALSLENCSGRVTDCTITSAAQAAIQCNNGHGIDISHNHIADCGNNGILVWQDKPGEDGTLVSNNRIERIQARAGGSGEYGNGINVFRANGVLVTSNRITDCAYSAVRGNASSNLQIIGNSCARLGEVAIYAEFGFEGAVIANNIVDTAATGISVTNFNEGGRLAVVQGNLIRNLFRRENEPEDKRGEGITIEADTLVSGNIIENAPTCGILVGWGAFMRDCVVSQNIVRTSRIGIMITSDRAVGTAVISGNLVTGAKDGAIRMMDRGAPLGPDLAVAGVEVPPRLAVSGNTAA